ncbi:hypothetical protein Nit79A3_3439 [Nitrosomonas sp. Is79A3]
MSICMRKVAYNNRLFYFLPPNVKYERSFVSLIGLRLSRRNDIAPYLTL